VGPHETSETIVTRAFAPSAWDDPGPLFSDGHRALASMLMDKCDLGGDAGLRDTARVGPRLGALGLYKYLLPNALGHGEDVDVRALCTIREVLAYHSPLADAVFAVQGLCANSLLLAGRRDVVDEMITGDRIGGFALTEPEAGSDVGAMKSVARRDGDDWILDGEKTLISNVGIAHHFVVFANANPALGKKGISAFLLPAESQGVELARIPLTGHHPLGRIVLSACRLPRSALLGEVGQGLRLAFATLETYRTSVGAAALGMAWRAIHETLVHVTSRAQFGQKLGDFQLVQAALADMATELCAARLLVASVARNKDVTEKAVGADVAMAKMHATEVAQHIIDRAVQLHGGLGVVLGNKIEELYREVRPLRIYEGATDILKLVVGQDLLRRHAAP
jgi:acyl-CoA dehydrogenase